MTVDRLKRVIWRLQELQKPRLTMKEVRRALMFECGTDERTIERNMQKLLELGFLKRLHGYVFKIGEDEV